MNAPPPASPSQRIAAIDALRGFDMFFLTGGLSIFLAVSRLAWNPVPEWLAYHTRHVPWIGFSAWDLVMPLFIFIVGSAMPFSIGKAMGQSPKWKIYLKILKRVVLLFLLGMVAQGNLLSFQPDRIHLFCNTLQAIAGGYLIAAICMLHLPRSWRPWIALVLLAVYALVLQFIPYGGNPAGTLKPDNNLALYIDKTLEGRFQDGTNYAWILPQLSFGALTLLGVWAGDILKHGTGHAQKVAMLATAGALSLGLGYAWSLQLPIIKHLFTSSMVLWAAGWCFLLLAVFYIIADILKQNWLFFPLKVIGCNAIFVYMWTCVCPPEGNLSRVLFAGFSACFGNASNFVFQLCNYALIWGILYFLYAKKTFIKI